MDNLGTAQATIKVVSDDNPENEPELEPELTHRNVNIFFNIISFCVQFHIYISLTKILFLIQEQSLSTQMLLKLHQRMKQKIPNLLPQDEDIIKEEEVIRSTFK